MIITTVNDIRTYNVHGDDVYEACGDVAAAEGSL